jgi:hypothetical protein
MMMEQPSSSQQRRARHVRALAVIASRFNTPPPL